MYTDVEVVENVDEDFTNALALLHSSKVDSAERLRRMLHATIEKKLRIPKRTIVVDFDEEIGTSEKSSRDDLKRRNSSLVKRIEEMTRASKNGICTVDINDDDSLENCDIPRISIPDETTDDYVVCKICKGDNLGPLILLECQECQDAYHPLCHQPPIVEIDVYDPRLVWRCGKCIVTSNTETTPDGDANRFVSLTNHCNASNRNRKNFVADAFSKMTSAVATKLDERETTEARCFGRTRSKQLENLENLPRRTTRSTEKNSFSASNSSSRMRKRVGSKISVTRLSRTT